MKRCVRSCLLVWSFLFLCGAGGVLKAHAQSMYTVTVDTTGISGLAGGLAFDFIAGDAITPNNTVAINAFTTDGALVGTNDINAGSASGDLPATVTLQDSGFSESFRGMTFGTSVSFKLSLTTHHAPPGVDEFSFFLTNASNSGSLVPTSDPTGSDALFVLDIDGSSNGTLSKFTASTANVSYTVVPSVSGVPEPTYADFAITALTSIGLLGWHRRRRKRGSTPYL